MCNLTLASPGATNSLGANKALLVDTDSSHVTALPQLRVMDLIGKEM